MSAVKFVLGADTLTLSRSINYTASRPTRTGQVLDETAAGTLEVETLGSPVPLFPLEITDMTSTDVAGLIDWRDNISDWAANSFTYYDENGDTHTVQWINDSIDFPQVSHGRYSAFINLRVVV